MLQVYYVRRFFTSNWFFIQSFFVKICRWPFTFGGRLRFSMTISCHCQLWIMSKLDQKFYLLHFQYVASGQTSRILRMVDTKLFYYHKYFLKLGKPHFPKLRQHLSPKYQKKYAMQILSILGWISTLTMTIAIAIALALVIIHDIHAILLLIPGQNSEELYVAPPARNLYLAFIIIPLIHALLYAIISGLALGLSARMGLTLKITLNSK